MKLIKSKYILAATILSSVVLTSCDNIAEDDRFLPVEKAEVKRVTLVQEFTGMLCPNCPKGAANILKAQEDYPGSVISVCIHPENNRFTTPQMGLDLTCHESTVLYQYYKPTGFPAAVINGAAPNTSYDLWPTEIEKTLEVPSPVSLEISTAYDKTTRELTVDYDVTFLDNYFQEASIMIWVVENGIKGMQIDGGRPVMDYIHNHVLRASMNGDWGQSLGTSFVFDQKITGEATMALSEKWVAENCVVVAYVFQTGNHNVEQAAEAHVIKE